MNFVLGTAFANTMARSQFVVAYVVAACLVFANGLTQEKTDYSAIINEVQKSGGALQGEFISQWDKLFSSQRKRVLALQYFLLKKQTAESKSALSDAFSQLNRNLTLVDTQFKAYNKQQGQEIQQLVQQYVSLLKERVNATGSAATNSTPIVQLRRDKMAMVQGWENNVLDVNSKYRAAYRTSLGAAVKAAASKPAVQKALREAFNILLEEAIDDQEENITLLATKQFPLVEEFALLAGKNLLELLVAAQAALL